jgi:hypothetical protein
VVKRFDADMWVVAVSTMSPRLIVPRAGSAWSPDTHPLAWQYAGKSTVGAVFEIFLRNHLSN